VTALVSPSSPTYRQVFRLGRIASGASVELLTHTTTPAAVLFLSGFNALQIANHPPIPLVRRVPDLPVQRVGPEAEAGATIA
jgi:hypothetical protein